MCPRRQGHTLRCATHAISRMSSALVDRDLPTGKKDRGPKKPGTWTPPLSGPCRARCTPTVILARDDPHLLGRQVSESSSRTSRITTTLEAGFNSAAGTLVFRAGARISFVFVTCAPILPWTPACSFSPTVAPWPRSDFLPPPSPPSPGLPRPRCGRLRPSRAAITGLSHPRRPPSDVRAGERDEASLCVMGFHPLISVGMPPGHAHPRIQRISRWRGIESSRRRDPS
jgi:hypothetical protein